MVADSNASNFSTTINDADHVQPLTATTTTPATTIINPALMVNNLQQQQQFESLNANMTSSTTMNTTTQIETTYMNHKTSYDVSYGTTGDVNGLGSAEIQVLPPTITSSAHPTMIETARPSMTIREPVYAVNRNGEIAFVTQQQPTTTINSQVQDNETEVRWRYPKLEEVINFLNGPDPMIRANSVAYLQHLSYADDLVKQNTRLLGGIPILIDLLNRDMLEVKRNVCGALRNLSYGRKNDDNKRAIRDSSGIQALIRAIIDNPDNEVRELATSVLWNLSSCEDIKWSIIDEALRPLVSVILVPYTAWFKTNLNSTQQFLPTVNETHWSTVFRNVTGVLRNISSAGAHARKQLRDCEGLVESLLFIINTSISRNDVENKLVENCVCILRNLSYRCQETQDVDYDKNYYSNNNSQTDSTNSMQNSPSSPSSSANLTTSLVGQMSSRVSDNLGCFSFGRRSKSKSKSKSSFLSSSKLSSQSTTQNSNERSSALLPPHHPTSIQANGHSSTLVRTSTQVDGFNNNSNATLPRSGISNIVNPNQTQYSGKDLLWQPEIVKTYLALLSGCSNSETLEAAAGAIQNLAACYWQPSVDIRAAVRQEKGLPVLVELLRMDRDRVVCVVATALRNLAIDQKNTDLIGKYAIPDLINKLNVGSDQESPSSEDILAAVLATLHEVLSYNVDFVRSFYEAGGLNKLTHIVRNKSKYSFRVQRFASQVLLDMWKFTELREMFRKGGWKESHFIVRPQIQSKNSTYSVNSNTIERPIASQQADRSSSMRNLRAISTSVPHNMLQQTPNNFNSAFMNQTYDSYPTYSSVQVTSLNGQVNNPAHALYAQVDRQRKRTDTGQNHNIV